MSKSIKVTETGRTDFAVAVTIGNGSAVYQVGWDTLSNYTGCDADTIKTLPLNGLCYKTHNGNRVTLKRAIRQVIYNFR